MLLQERILWIQNLFFEEISRSFVIIFGQETHEHVKTIKKRCLEAKHDIFFVKMDAKKGMFSWEVSLPGCSDP